MIISTIIPGSVTDVVGTVPVRLIDKEPPVSVAAVCNAPGAEYVVRLLEWVTPRVA